MYDSNFRFPNEEPDEVSFAAKPREPRKPRPQVAEARKVGMSVITDGIRVYWGDNFDEPRKNFLLGISSTLQEAIKVAVAYKKRRQVGQEGYCRFWIHNSTTLVMDYGSHIQFFLFVGEDIEKKFLETQETHE